MLCVQAFRPVLYLCSQLAVLLHALRAGTLKKGKAARQAQELLIRAADVTPRERDMMRAVPEMDMINAMVSTACFT